jgi:FMN phosphatase YigB (HAD superfamily)
MQEEKSRATASCCCGPARIALRFSLFGQPVPTVAGSSRVSAVARCARICAKPDLSLPRLVKPSTPDAVILDVDGTMYVQRRVRLGMLLRLSRYALRHPREGLGCLQALGAYRRAQEELRDDPVAGGHAGRDQLALAARMAGVGEDTVRRHVEQWMEHVPLDLIARAARPGLRDFLVASREHGACIGVFSDYGAEDKLAALGIRDLVDVVRSAQDDVCGRFKPDPAGLLLVAAELGVDPGSAVYVGDRPEVDAIAAERAGMRAFIVTGTNLVSHSDWVPVRDFAELTTVLFAPGN